MKPWNWHQFVGSAPALKWARKDLPSLELAIAVTPGRTAVVQAGGSLGIFPKRLAASFATVYTFEPAVELFQALCRNAPEANIYRFQAALGCQRHPVSVRRARRDGSSGPLHEGLGFVDGAGVIPTLMIDDLGLPVCDLIYLDIEGYEYFALQGAKETIARCRPVIAIEINKHTAEVGVPEELVRALLDLSGYQQHQAIRSDEIYLPKERAA